MDMTTVYLRIIFLGAPFTYFYNALSTALKSVGDSKTPLKFLMFSSVLNGVLDLIFIGGLGFGIVCSAVTTVIAEAVSAGLSIWYVYRSIPMLQLRRGEFVIDRALLKTTLAVRLGDRSPAVLPAGGQGPDPGLGQHPGGGYDRSLQRRDPGGRFCLSAGAEHLPRHYYLCSPKPGRGKDGASAGRLRQGLLLEFGYWVGIICGLVLLLRGPIVSLFVSSEDAAAIVAVGAQYLGAMAFFYIFPAFTNGFQGFYRGMGMMKMTLLGTFIQTVPEGHLSPGSSPP